MADAQLATDLLRAWSSVRAVDHHCHPLWRFTRPVIAADLRSLFTEALDARMAEHVVATAGYRDALRRIAAQLGCAPSEDAILAARAKADPPAYAAELLQRSGTGLLLLDSGYTSADTFTMGEHAKSVRIEQREVVRLELLAESLIATASTVDEWFGAVRGQLRTAKAGGAVGVKSIAAYRAGLRLRPTTSAERDADFARFRAAAASGGMVRLAGRPLVHGLLVEAAQECRALDLPLQVHCGFGDPDEDLAECSPLGLRRLLTDQNLDGLRIILLHCYPYHREAAYLCSVFPGVFMDLSLTLPLAGLDGARAMQETLGLCPWSKLLYASDASRLPEYFLVAAAVQREALAGAFAELIDRRVLTRDDAIGAGIGVLAANARRVYRLP